MWTTLIQKLIEWYKESKNDYTKTDYTQFEFKDKDELKSLGKFQDTIWSPDLKGTNTRRLGGEFVKEVKYKGRHYVAVGLYEWDISIQSKIWNEKYEADPHYVHGTGFHVNFYYNNRQDFNPALPMAYFDKHCRYKFTVMKKDDPAISWLSDHIRNLQPFHMLQELGIEENFKEADRYREGLNKEYNKRISGQAQFQFPENETAYPEEDPNEVAKTEQVVGIGLSQLTDCVNNTKTHAMVQYVTKKLKDNGLSLQDVKQCAYGLALYNNTQIVGMIVNNAIARYPERAQEFPAIGTGRQGPLAIGSGEKNETYQIPSNVTFSEIGRASCRERV